MRKNSKNVVTPIIKSAIIALREGSRFSVPEIAEMVKVPASTVRRVLKDRSAADELSPDAIRKALASQFFSATHRFLELAMQEERLAKMSSYQLIGMAGVTHQNARLAMGETTANIGIAAVVEKATRERLAAGD